MKIYLILPSPIVLVREDFGAMEVFCIIGSTAPAVLLS